MALIYHDSRPRMLSCAALALCVMLPLTSAAQKQMPASPVVVSKAMTREIAPIAWVSGTVVSLDDAHIASEVDGNITWLATVGQYIEQGEPLAIIDDTRLKLQQQEAASNVQAIATRIGFLKKDVERLTRLAKLEHASKTTLEQTVSNYDVARAELEAANARLALIQDKLEKTRIRAPFAGYVTEQLKMTGEHVSESQAVVHLTGTQNTEIEASAPLRHVGNVRPGSELLVSQDETRSMATVRSLVSIGAGKSRQFIMRLGFDQPGWLPGQPVRVAVPTETPAARLVIPRDALVIRREGKHVYRVKADNSVERVDVMPGVASGQLIAVESELADGDTVVVRGGERLRPGQQVKVLREMPVTP